jgi:hypothetical protein
MSVGVIRVIRIAVYKGGIPQHANMFVELNVNTRISANARMIIVLIRALTLRVEMAAMSLWMAKVTISTGVL